MSDVLLKSLKTVREKAGFTQKQVEQQLGMRSLMMRDYETGRMKLPAVVAVRLAQLYQVSVDELMGLQQVPEGEPRYKVLSTFNSLFLGDGYNVMFLDPILRAFLEDHHEGYLHRSMFDLLSENFSEKLKKETVVEINQFLFSLAGADDKVSDEEIDCIRFLVRSFDLQSRYQDITKFAERPHLPVNMPKGFERVEMRHFLIWILFFFASADQVISIEEINYIEKVAESLRVNRSNFLFIKNKFVEEEL